MMKVCYALNSWLLSHDIPPESVKLVLRVRDSRTKDRIQLALFREIEPMLLPITQQPMFPTNKGSIAGISFSITTLDASVKVES
jgi:hypothetical protein